MEFQSTPSARRATLSRQNLSYQFLISIHALREESDLPNAEAMAGYCYFNPRPPRGERQSF